MYSDKFDKVTASKLSAHHNHLASTRSDQRNNPFSIDINCYARNSTWIAILSGKLLRDLSRSNLRTFQFPWQKKCGCTTWTSDQLKTHEGQAFLSNLCPSWYTISILSECLNILFTHNNTAWVSTNWKAEWNVRLPDKLSIWAGPNKRHSKECCWGVVPTFAWQLLPLELQQRKEHDPCACIWSFYNHFWKNTPCHFLSLHWLDQCYAWWAHRWRMWWRKLVEEWVKV